MRLMRFNYLGNTFDRFAKAMRILTIVTNKFNEILHNTMQYNPKTFITTVGLYNNAAELVAVAKLSQPVAKDFTKEALIRVKLDY